MQHKTRLGNPAAVHNAAQSLAVPSGVAQSGSIKLPARYRNPIGFVSCAISRRSRTGSSVGSRRAAAIASISPDSLMPSLIADFVIQYMTQMRIKATINSISPPQNMARCICASKVVKFTGHSFLVCGL